MGPDVPGVTARERDAQESDALMAHTVGSILWSVVGILVSGLAGGLAGWSVIAALELTGAVGALIAAVIGMVVATGVWLGLTVALRKLGVVQ